MYDTNQLHAAVVELVALDNAEIKYSVQNWYAGDENGKAVSTTSSLSGAMPGVNSKISWTQVETGSYTKYPIVLVGIIPLGEFTRWR